MRRCAHDKPVIALEAPVDLDVNRARPHEPCDLPEAAAPVLVAVVDTEEEFDWSAPFDRAGTAVGHMAAIGRVQDVFDSMGGVPSYLLSYAIASQKAGHRPVEPYLAAGRALIGGT